MLPKFDAGKGNIQNLTPYRRLLGGEEGQEPPREGQCGADHFSWQVTTTVLSNLAPALIPLGRLHPLSIWCDCTQPCPGR